MSLFDNPPLHNFPDRAIREALEQAANLRDVLIEAVPDLAAHLDFNRARYIKPAFLLEDWRQRESDLLCLIPYLPPGTGPAEEVLICVLLEHQSRPDPHMPLRVLLYAVLFWEQQWKEYERRHEEGAALRLTPVIPIVFHTGLSVWSSNRRLADLFAGPEGLRAYAPQWPLLFWDLAARTPEQLLASGGPFAQFLALVRAENSDAEDFRQVVETLVERLDSVAAQDKMRWRDLLWLVVSWVLQRRPAGERDALLGSLVDRQRDLAQREEVKTVSDATKMSWGQLYEARIKTEAKAAAEEATKASALQTEREILIGLLSAIDDKLPESLLASIRACEDSDRLKAAIFKTRALTSLDQFQL
jgi:hypothetical protein